MLRNPIYFVWSNHSNGIQNSHLDLQRRMQCIKVVEFWESWLNLLLSSLRIIQIYIHLKYIDVKSQTDQQKDVNITTTKVSRQWSCNFTTEVSRQRSFKPYYKSFQTVKLQTLLQKFPDNEPANLTTKGSRQWTCQLHYKSFQTVKLPTLLQKFPDNEPANFTTKVSRQWTYQLYYRSFQTMNLPTLLQKFPDSEPANFTTKVSRQWSFKPYYKRFQTVKLQTLLQKFPDSEASNLTTEVSRQWSFKPYYKSFQTMNLPTLLQKFPLKLHCLETFVVRFEASLSGTFCSKVWSFTVWKLL